MSEEKVFTQAEVNQIVAERLNKERSKQDKNSDDRILELQKQLDAANGKYTELAKRTALLNALKENNAVNPGEISKLLAGNVTVKDDGRVVFKGENDKEISVNDGVKSYLSNNDWAVGKNSNPFIEAGFIPAQSGPLNSGNDSLRSAFDLPAK